MQRKKTILVCKECLARNYTTYSSPQPTQIIEKKKHCKECNKHTVHKETR